MTRKIYLDQHVGKVDIDEYILRDHQCECLIWLTDRERYVVLSHLLPFAEWETRFVRPVERNLWETATDGERAEYTDFINDLTIKLTGGDTEMGCNSQIYNGLLALADSIRASGSNGGSCGNSGSAAILNCIGGMTEEELIPQSPEGDQVYGTPPEGFESWSEYLVYKCQAANAVFDTVYNLFGAMAILPIVQASVTVIGTVLGGYIAATAFGAVAFPPAGILAIAVAAATIGALDGLAFAQALTIQAHLYSHKEEIVCQLYTSGTAVDAITALGNALEDAIQTVEWSAIFGPTAGPEIAAAFGSIASQAVTNNLVNPLFRLVVDFSYPGADCESCGQQPGAGMSFSFDADVDGFVPSFVTPDEENDEADFGWEDAPATSDPFNGSPGCLFSWIQEATAHGATWVVWTRAIEEPLVVAAGQVLSADVIVNNPDYCGVDLIAHYDDDTSSTQYFPNVGGGAWAEIYLPLTAGKTLETIEIKLGVGETTSRRDFFVDHVAVEMGD